MDQVLREALAAERPCQVRLTHTPIPVVTQGHHRYPIFLQKRLWGEVRLAEILWVCGTDHDSIHAWLYWLLGEREHPGDPGRLVRAEAQRIHEWYAAELARR